MKSKSIEVSVIIPTRKRASSLKRTLVNLLRKLDISDEVIVVDNYGLDEVKKIVKNIQEQYIDKKIIYLFEKKIGASYARNKGIAFSSKHVVAFLDDDCLVTGKWLRTIKNFYSNKKNSKIVLQGKIRHHFVKKEIFFENILRLKNQYKSQFFLKDKNSIYVNYLNAGNFACTKNHINGYKKFFDEKNFPHIGEEIELAYRLNKDNFYIVLSDEMLVDHYKQEKIFLFRLIVMWKYGFYIAKVKNKFLLNKYPVLKIFKEEISRYNFALIDQAKFIYENTSSNKLLSILYFLLIELIYKVSSVVFLFSNKINSLLIQKQKK